MNLPQGLTARPLTVDDIDATITMVNGCERFDTGELMWERADLLVDASVEGFDPTADWVGVFEDERIVAWGLLQIPRAAFVDVAPEMRGRGIGTALRTWTIERARERGGSRIGQTIDESRTSVVEDLLAAGFTPRHTSWILRMDHDTEPPAPEVPQGIQIRPIRLPDEEIDVLTMFETAFSEFDDRGPTPLAYWHTTVIEREGFTPEDLPVATDGARIVGGAFFIDADETWVDKLAVAKSHRHRGIARALLQTAFKRSFERGYDHTALSTDSRTGALTLYERVGMRVTRSFTHLAIDL